jgi:hemerythrin-like metal-binding protein
MMLNLLQNENWVRWILQTARCWEDVSDVIERTGIDFIDDDHRQIVEHAMEMEQLIQALEGSRLDLDTVRREAVVLDRLYDVVLRHFRDEEALIVRFKLGFLSRQREQHHQFLRELETRIHDFHAGQILGIAKLRGSVLEWIVNHINTLDFKTFCLQNWLPAALRTVTIWEDIQPLVRNTGFHHIDEEHRELVTLTLEIGRRVEKNDPESMLRFLDMLRQYAVNHFQHEDALGQTMPRGDYASHALVHESFLQRLHRWVVEIRHGTVPSSDVVRHEVLGWWLDHINRLDYALLRKEEWRQHLVGTAASWDVLSEVIRMTGMDAIDAEHRKISQVLISLDGVINVPRQDRMQARWIRRGLEILDELTDVSRIHFAHEEQVIQQYLPDEYTGDARFGYEVQRKMHQKVLYGLERLRQDVENKRLVLSTRIKFFLLDRWREHINGMDCETFRLDRLASRLLVNAQHVDEVMPLIKQCGIAVVDRDHQGVARQMIRLRTCTRAHEAMDVLATIYQYVEDHFRWEEQFMATSYVTSLAVHRDKHQAMLRLLLCEMGKLSQGDGVWPTEEMFRVRRQLLQEWMEHTSYVDFYTFEPFAGTETR